MPTTSSKDECTDLDQVNKNNFEQIKNKAMKIGYAEGASDGRERFFQNGFDQGYADGLAASLDLEKFRFFFNHLNTDEVNNKDLVKEKEVCRTLSTADLKSLLLKDHSLNIVSQECIKDINKFKQKMPVATKLLNMK